MAQIWFTRQTQDLVPARGQSLKKGGARSLGIDLDRHEIVVELIMSSKSGKIRWQDFSISKFTRIKLEEMPRRLLDHACAIAVRQ